MSGAMSGGFNMVLSWVTYNAGLTTEYARLAGPGPDYTFSTISQSDDSNESKKFNIIGYPLNHNLHIIERQHIIQIYLQKNSLPSNLLLHGLTQNDSGNYNYTEIMKNMKRK
jgi:hypothetical protein